MNSSDIDQALAEIRENLPATWWAIFSGCLDKGFTREESLKLTITYLSTLYKRLS